MLHKPAILVLADGNIYQGISIGAEGSSAGELVFNTSMTGYQEMLTDPSYTQQIITLTTAHVGNTGCNLDDMESSRIWASGLVINNYTSNPSNYRSSMPLHEWLIQENIVAIAGIDTRKLTLSLRDNGAINACISTDVSNVAQALELAQAFSGLNGKDLAKEVSRKKIEAWQQGRGEWGIPPRPAKYHVVVYDFGTKSNILRILYDLGCKITLVPAQTSADEVIKLNPDGILLSNGPGDPAACTYAIEATKKLLSENIPIFGICLGFQILGLALGAKTKKMKFGHHGANHPVIELQSNKRVFITSQNHGFTIDQDSLPTEVIVTHRSLFDQSLQGIKHRSKPVIAFQGHPEAGPGPHDIEVLFEDFFKMMSQKEM